VIAPAWIPTSLVKRARGYLRRAGQQLLLGPRRPSTDHLIQALPGDSGRYLLILDPQSHLGQLVAEMVTGGRGAGCRASEPEEEAGQHSSVGGVTSLD